jgi:hypothetical protein
VSIEFISVWKRITPELATELVDFWNEHNAIGGSGAGTAAIRARQAVCIARDDRTGGIVGVGTAFVRVLPQLRQPLYYYRQFFAPALRGKAQAIPFFNHARQVLEAYNASLSEPECLGVLLELENSMLASHYVQAYVAAAHSTFIGFSSRGLQLRVSYFDGARLLAPRLAPVLAVVS